MMVLAKVRELSIKHGLHAKSSGRKPGFIEAEAMKEHQKKFWILLFGITFYH